VATQVILDTSDTSECLEGFHFAHLCNDHAARALGEAMAGESEGK